jgi:hypothetical protein
MGYIHDTNMQTFVTSMAVGTTGGTWTSVADGDQWYKQRAALAGSFFLNVPVAVPVQNSTDKRGCKVTSIEIYYSLYDAGLTSLAADVWLQALPASGAFAAPTAVTFTYDTAHDAAGERITETQHVMTLTLTTPTWIAGDEYMWVKLTGVAGASALFRIWGARINYTMRV